MDDLTPEEIQEIERIIYGFFLKEYKNEKKAQIMMQKLAGMLQDPGVKLVHFGNTVFMYILVEPQVAEIHTMSLDEGSAALAKNLVSFLKFLQNIGIKEAYSYSDDPKFGVIVKRTRLPIETRTEQAQDGKTYTIYSIRFQ
jgi:hypothetical protein